MLFKTLAIAATVGSAAAQASGNASLCDKYTIALLKNNTAANQMTLLTLVVNTAVIGNYTQPNVGVAVPGILAPGTFEGTKVNLAPYFNGGLASTNTGGLVGNSINFLDGGGAEPLMANKAANNETSNQFRLLTHLYEYFGVLLGCSLQGGADYPAYSGHASQYQVHKFMDLSNAEVEYFIQQVGLSALSFGVTADDAAAVGKALKDTFGFRCSAPAVVVPAQGAQLQSICTDNTCPIASNATCASYNETIPKPSAANSSASGATGSGGSSTTATGTAGGAGSTQTSEGSTPIGSNPATVSQAGAASVGLSFAVVAGGLAALFL